MSDAPDGRGTRLRRGPAPDLELTLRGDGPCRSFVFDVRGRRPLTLSWKPGRLAVDGDEGRLAIERHHETGSLARALAWAADAEVDYLLGHSDAERVVDRDATFLDFIRRLDEPAIDALRAASQEARDARRDWDEEAATLEGEVADGWDGMADLPRRPGWPSASALLRIGEAAPGRGGRGHLPPQGYGRWYDAWSALSGRGLAGTGPESILSPGGRRILKGAIRHLVDLEGTTWRDFARDADPDADEVVTREWNRVDVRLATALRDASRAALARVRDEKAGRAACGAAGARQAVGLVAMVRAHRAAIRDGSTQRGNLGYLRDEVDEVGDELDLVEAGRAPGPDGVAGEAIDVVVAALNMVLEAAPGMTDAEVLAYADRKCAKWRAKLAAGAYGS